MKRLLPLLTMAAVAASGCSQIRRLDSSRHEVLPVPQALADASKMEAIQHRVDQGDPVIFKVDAGQQMPFKLAVDLPVGKLEPTESPFTFTRDTYFLLTKRRFELSPDGQRWASITSRKGLAKLFGFTRGEFSAGFTAVTNQGAFMNVSLSVK